MLCCSRVCKHTKPLDRNVVTWVSFLSHLPLRAAPPQENLLIQQVSNLSADWIMPRPLNRDRRWFLTLNSNLETDYLNSNSKRWLRVNHHSSRWSGEFMRVKPFEEVDWKVSYVSQSVKSYRLVSCGSPFSLKHELFLQNPNHFMS